ncbi:hypothetical protein, partial [Nocardia cyriacigeorgica]|uniref:hypothetical protein n=1 Tax=Nocardia cyriacigeorgica TaxID=135487 RepID=UPI002456FDB5
AQRGAQFVAGVGDEAALAVEGRVQPGEVIVVFCFQARDLGVGVFGGFLGLSIGWAGRRIRVGLEARGIRDAPV